MKATGFGPKEARHFDKKYAILQRPVVTARRAGFDDFRRRARAHSRAARTPMRTNDMTMPGYLGYTISGSDGSTMPASAEEVVTTFRHVHFSF